MDSVVTIELLQEALEVMGGLVVIDKRNKIVYMNINYAHSMGIDAKDYIGMSMTDLLPDSRLPIVTETGKEVIADFYSLKNGHTLVVNRVPIIKNGEIVGAIGYTTFGNADEIENLNDIIGNLYNEAKYYKSELATLRGSKYSIDQIISNDYKMSELKKFVEKAAQTKSTVLISGESGTGKELFAHAIHKLSPRNHMPFIRLNCAAIPENLLESELFGYEEGSFTGAKKGGSLGKFEIANNGTLLLDEINSLPINLQAKLLRVLQEKEIQKVGAMNPLKVDVRMIFSSNQDLLKMVSNGTFREDLYYRINVIELKIPPLRERMHDIPLLVGHLIPKLNKELGLYITGVEPAVIDLFLKYSWPGNVRELENCIERAFNNALSGELKLGHFDFLYSRIGMDQSLENGIFFSLHQSREVAEKKAIIHALKLSDGNKKRAAEMLEIDRSILYDKIKKYKIELV